jgi:hypothetical protein
MAKTTADLLVERLIEWGVLKGQKDGWKILKTVIKDGIREVV